MLKAENCELRVHPCIPIPLHMHTYLCAHLYETDADIASCEFAHAIKLSYHFRTMYF